MKRKAVSSSNIKFDQSLYSVSMQSPPTGLSVFLTPQTGQELITQFLVVSGQFFHKSLGSEMLSHMHVCVCVCVYIFARAYD